MSASPEAIATARLEAVIVELREILVGRMASYGDPVEHCVATAQRWRAAIGSPRLVAMAVPRLMVEMKLQRLTQQAEHRDSWLDVAGWALIAAAQIEPEAPLDIPLAPEKD